MMAKLWDRIRLLPVLLRLSSRAPRDSGTAWDSYWAGIGSTGPGGDVLWDAGADAERRQYLPLLRAHLDASLPVIDVGCGNGTFTRWLAGLFPQAVGID